MLMLRRLCQSPRFPLWTQLRGAFTDALRTEKLDQAIQYKGGDSTSQVPIAWEDRDVAQMEMKLRKKLRACDFVVEVRDARIPVSTLHPKLRGWAGKKPRVMVFNKADMISHRDKVEWERHFEQKNMNVYFLQCLENTPDWDCRSFGRQLL